MSISDRYRGIAEDARVLLEDLRQAAGDEESREIRIVAQAVTQLRELEDQVGEIPRIRLESKLTPVLLKAHSSLDRARLLMEEQGAEDRASSVWDMEQKLYRLLNDL
ncbi:MAG: hypothetical protein C0617_08880 [Desulfuromonas sp.]|uniref:hypothetical protein n=1 Tax=Desulfuromonas sp. TaxID=892 RepID=UPI000CC3014A|nr:hypothetical protein [Desulfuromonas sp.]PLX84181.1 MAG: hypothetical protein C0617_08880 [Desulfuromonas sp.]